MAKTLRSARKGIDKEPLRARAQPYKRATRREPDPTLPEVKQALADCHDLGECGRRLRQSYPAWTEAQRLSVLKAYLVNLQIRWANSLARAERVGLANRLAVVDRDRAVDDIETVLGEMSADIDGEADNV